MCCASKIYRAWAASERGPNHRPNGGTNPLRTGDEPASEQRANEGQLNEFGTATPCALADGWFKKGEEGDGPSSDVGAAGLTFNPL